MPGSIKSIAIINDSIPGLIAAIALRLKGIKVKVFSEPSPSKLKKDNGTSAILPTAFIEKKWGRFFFNANIPRLPPIISQSFLVKDQTFPQGTRPIFQQPFSFISLNSSPIYKMLRKWIPNRDQVECDLSKVWQEVNDLPFDAVIDARGVESSIQQDYFSSSGPKYRDYIAWSGGITDQKIATDPFFFSHLPVYFFSNGHLIFYLTPAHDCEKSGKVVLNWILYERPNDPSIKNPSLSSESISKTQATYLHALAQAVLPPSIAEIICKTQKPLIQSVFDIQMQRYVHKRICRVGDGAISSTPHTIDSLEDALERTSRLVDALDPPPGTAVDDSLSAWSNTEVALAKEQNTRSHFLGKQFVTTSPQLYTPEGLATIFKQIGHFRARPKFPKTDEEVIEELRKRKQFIPKFDKEIQNLCIGLEKVKLNLDDRNASTAPQPKL
jgi:hypothetical protein